MPAYPHFVPFLSPAPPPGYRSTQVLPLDAVRRVLDRNDATLDILREIIFEGEVVRSDSSALVLKDGVWTDPELGTYEIDPVDGSDWAVNAPMAFLQTTVTARDAMFSQLREPGFYTVYSGPGRKSFLSDSSQKFAHPVIIGQVAEYGKWAEGYPSCIVEPDHDAGESVVLLNPYEKPALATLEIEGVERRHKFRIQPFSGRRIDIAPLLDPTMLPWCGQIYVTGPRRVVTFFIKHALSDPTSVNTIEHTDPYRGETAWAPFTRALHWKYKTKFGLHAG
jgi:hypothetical protein